jgi:amino acid transporter
VLSASALLLFAANTALIGGYHVFLALARGDYLPKILAKRNRLFGTPHVGIIFFTAVTFLIVHLTNGHLETLGHLYSFGLLGAFTFTSLGLDVIRWREKERGPKFWVGLLTTAMVSLAWAVNIVYKRAATLFGGSVVASSALIGVAIRKDWRSRIEPQLPWVAHEPPGSASAPRTSSERRSRRDRLDLRPRSRRPAIGALAHSSVSRRRDSNPRASSPRRSCAPAGRATPRCSCWA